MPTVKILKVEPVTHDVRRFTVEKPEGFRFEPGQATLVSITRPEWQQEKRPFTFTSLNEWPELEFTIKIYADRHGVTDQLGRLQAGDELIVRKPWGTIQYKGPGYFIAGGAGVTPFIAILRQLRKEGQLAGNTLLFSNKTSRDIILRDEFEAMEGLSCVFTVTHDPTPASRAEESTGAFSRTRSTTSARTSMSAARSRWSRTSRTTLPRSAPRLTRSCSRISALSP
jgi:ferredoxin-NADP reductase